MASAQVVTPASLNLKSSTADNGAVDSVQTVIQTDEDGDGRASLPDDQSMMQKVGQEGVKNLFK